MSEITGNNNVLSGCENEFCQSTLIGGTHEDNEDESDDIYTLDTLTLFENCPGTGEDLYLCPSCYKEKSPEAGERRACESSEYDKDFDISDFANTH